MLNLICSLDLQEIAFKTAFSVLSVLKCNCNDISILHIRILSGRKFENQVVTPAFSIFHLRKFLFRQAQTFRAYKDPSGYLRERLYFLKKKRSMPHLWIDQECREYGRVKVYRYLLICESSILCLLANNFATLHPNRLLKKNRLRCLMAQNIRHLIFENFQKK